MSSAKNKFRSIDDTNAILRGGWTATIGKRCYGFRMKPELLTIGPIIEEGKSSD